MFFVITYFFLKQFENLRKKNCTGMRREYSCEANDYLLIEKSGYAHVQNRCLEKKKCCLRVELLYRSVPL